MPMRRPSRHPRRGQKTILSPTRGSLTYNSVMNSTNFYSTTQAGDEWQSIAQACVETFASDLVGFNLGFLYVTDALTDDLGAILDYFKTQTGIDHWYGSVGMGICGTAIEIYDEPAISVMVANVPDDSFRTLPVVAQDLSAMLAANHEWITQHDARFGVVHGDPANPHVSQLIEALANTLEAGFLVGGLSSSSSDTHPQIAESMCSGGLSGVLLGAEIPVITGLSQGCSPIGPKHIITEAERNVLVEIDGQPALDVFREDIGEILSRDLSRVGGYIFAGFPIPGSDTDDYLVRNLVGIDVEQKLVAVGDLIESGDPVMFCRRDSDTARADLQRLLDNLKKRAGDTVPKAGLYYSCLGRGRYQFGENSEELKMIRDTLGDFPLSGFFANGEISHNRLYGYTGVLTLFL